MSSTDIYRSKVRRRFSFSLRVFLGPGMALFLIISLILFHQNFLIVREVDCSMGDSSCPEAIQTLLDREKGHSFLRINYKEIQRGVLATGLVDGIAFQTKLKGKLIAKTQPPAVVYYVKTAVSLATPGLSFFTSSTSAAPSAELASFVATTEGKTFQLLSAGVLSQAEVDSNYFLIAQSIPTKDYLTKAFGWLYSLSLSSMKPDALYFFSDMIILKEKDQPDLIMNFSDDPRETLLALQRLGEVVTIKKPTVIDFRYNHPILK